MNETDGRRDKEMEQAEKLTVLLEKYRKNRENVPLEVLKTKYKDAYEKLKAEIKTEAQTLIRPVATKVPPWLEGQLIKQEYAEEMAGAFNQLYEADCYAKKIGQALYKHYSITEALQLAGEVNSKYQEALLKIFHQKTCLYTTAENWDPENPVTPRIYNALVDKFWDEEKGEWITAEKPPGNALLIFITGDKPVREEADHE